MATFGFNIPIGGNNSTPQIGFSPVNTGLNNLSYKSLDSLSTDIKDFLNSGKSLNNSPISSVSGTGNYSTTNSTSSSNSNSWIGPVVSAGLGLASGIISNSINGRIASDNLESQKENLAYQKALQQEIFNREDTAFQRAVLDLEKSGLSKTLALPSGAGTGAVVDTSAPKYDYNYSQVLTSALLDSFNDFRNTSANITLMNAQARLLDAQTKQVDLETELDKKYSGSERESNLAFKIAQTSYITDVEMDKGRQELINLVSSNSLTNANIEKVLSDIGVNSAYTDELVTRSELNASHVKYYDALTAKQKEELKTVMLMYDIYNIQKENEQFLLDSRKENKRYYDYLGVPYNFSGTPIYTSGGSSLGLQFSSRSSSFGGSISSWGKDVVTLDVESLQDLLNVVNRTYDSLKKGDTKGAIDLLERRQGIY